MSNYFRLWFKWIKYIFSRLVIKPNVKLKELMRYMFFQRLFYDEYMRLDVGCGIIGKGLVNIDLFINAPEHRSGGLINIKETNNFVLCDVHYSPFRNKVFRCARIIHVLEHLNNPIMGLKEISRISKKLFICVPSPINPYTDTTTTHYYTWNKNTLYNILKLSFNYVNVILSPYELIGVASN